MRRSSLIGSPLLNSIRKAASPSSQVGWSSTMTPQVLQYLSETSPLAFREATKRASLLAATVFVSHSVETPGGFLARTTFSIMESPGRLRRVIEYWLASRSHLLHLLDFPNLVLNDVDASFHVSTSPVTMQQVVRELPALLFAGWRTAQSPACVVDFPVMNPSGGATPDTCSRPTSSTSKCRNTAQPKTLPFSIGFEQMGLFEWRSN